MKYNLLSDSTSDVSVYNEKFWCSDSPNITNYSVTGSNTYNYLPKEYQPANRNNTELRQILHQLNDLKSIDDIITTSEENSHFLLFFNMNDCRMSRFCPNWNDYKIEETYNNIKTFYNLFPHRITFITPLPTSGVEYLYHVQLCHYLRSFYPHIDVFSALANFEYKLKNEYDRGDNLHLNELGQSIIKREVVRSLNI